MLVTKPTQKCALSSKWLTNGIRSLSMISMDLSKNSWSSLQHLHMIRTLNTTSCPISCWKMPVIWGAQGLPIPNTTATSFQNWIGEMAGMIPSLVIQVSMPFTTASWAIPSKFQNPTKNPIMLVVMLSSEELTSSAKIPTSFLRCASTSTYVVSTRLKIQKQRTN